MDQLGLVQAINGLGRGVVVAVALAAHGGSDAGLGQSLAVADADILRAPAAGLNQGPIPLGLLGVQRLLKRIQHEVRVSRQPTMRRAYTSKTKATYSQPCQVDT